MRGGEQWSPTGIEKELGERYLLKKSPGFTKNNRHDADCRRHGNESASEENQRDYLLLNIVAGVLEE
jgi:hypothetical protein